MIPDLFGSGIMSLHYKKDRVSIGAQGVPDFQKNRKIFIFRHISGHFRTTETLDTTILHVFDVRFFLPFLTCFSELLQMSFEVKRRAFLAFFYRFKLALSNHREIGHPFLPVVMRLARVSRIFSFETVTDVATLDRCQHFIPPGHEETLHFFDGVLSLPVIRIFEQLS